MGCVVRSSAQANAEEASLGQIGQRVTVSWFSEAQGRVGQLEANIPDREGHSVLSSRNVPHHSPPALAQGTPLPQTPIWKGPHLEVPLPSPVPHVQEWPLLWPRDPKPSTPAGTVRGCALRWPGAGPAAALHLLFSHPGPRLPGPWPRPRPCPRGSLRPPTNSGHTVQSSGPGQGPQECSCHG